jgi:hypothetical protein
VPNGHSLPGLVSLPARGGGQACREKPLRVNQLVDMKPAITSGMGLAECVRMMPASAGR